MHDTPVADEFVVVLRARSGAYFVPEGGWQLNLEPVAALGVGALRIRTFTRWVGAGDASLPRELVLEVRGRASSLDDAIAKFAAVARPIATVIGFVANVRVGPVEVHLAFDAAPGRQERAFLETFIADDRELPQGGRIIREDLLSATCIAVLGMRHDSARLNRALRQYELALRQWHVGGEWLALSHLYMAVEALTQAILRAEMRSRGLSQQELAMEFDVITDDPSRPRWRPALEEEIRKRVIFDGDLDTYKAAKAASDGLEHGFLELDAVARHAIACTDATFAAVRRSIVALLELPDEIGRELLALSPRDVQSMRKVARGSLLNTGDDPAAPGELYPYLHWVSSIPSVTREGTSFEMQQQERLTVRASPGSSFRLERLEVFGRLVDGNEPTAAVTSIEASEAGPEVDGLRLVDQAVAMFQQVGGGQTYPLEDFAQDAAFIFLGQGVAYLEAAHALLRVKMPAEALPTLRGLTVSAARFEQMAAKDGPGLGIAVRMLADAIQEGGTATGAAATAGALVDRAVAIGLSVPVELPDVADSLVYQTLSAEMTLADAAIADSCSVAQFHVAETDESVLAFHTQLAPGHFTDLITSACVLAAMSLLTHASAVLGWEVEPEPVARLSAEAQVVNLRAAAGEHEAGPDAEFASS